MPGIRDHLESLYNKVRTAMAEYDLESACPYLNIPEGTPEPTREQAGMMADMMPDIENGRFLLMKSADNRIGLYYETALEDATSSEVTVIRFEEREGSWGLASDTFNSASTDPVSPAFLLSRIETDPDLKLTP